METITPSESSRTQEAGPSGSASAPLEEKIDFVEVAGGEPPSDVTEEIPDPDSAPVARLVQTIIADALRLGASRLLILPVGGRVKVAYRIQDAVCSRRDLPLPMLYPVLVRLMAMANLSGFIKLLAGDREYKLHVVFKPTRYGLSALMDIAQDVSVVEVCRAKAAKLGCAFLALEEHHVPKAVLSLVPEAVARENGVLPVGLEGNVLKLATGVPLTPEAVERLRFTLNRPIALALAPEGAVLGAIDRYYGPADPETADLVLWELAQTSQSAEPQRPAPSRPRLLESVPDPARPLLEHLRTIYRDKLLELFESLASAAVLCRQEPISGDLEVVFAQSHLMSQMPSAARRYLENRIWALREAIVSRLENFLEKDSAARGMAMTYSQYLAFRQLAEGHRVSINPATAQDAWLNFVYALAIRSFPAIDSNGALLSFVNEHLDQLSAKVASLLDDATLVVDPARSRQQLACLERQTTTDEALDFDSPPIVHLMELLIAEAVHRRASAVALVPQEDRVEVAYRIQRAVYCRESLALSRLYPLLARLRMFTELSGDLAVTVGQKERRLRITLHRSPHGLAAVIEILPDIAAIEACQALAAKLGHAFVRLDEAHVPTGLLKPIPKAVAWKKLVFPLTLHESALTVAMSTPPTPRRLDELRLIFKRTIVPALATEDDILAAIYRHYHPHSMESPVSATALTLLACEGSAGA